MPNVYELAHRAIRLTSAVACGPDGKSCDGGAPVYRCPAHGGEHDDETPNDVTAREEWDRRWRVEVMQP
jgi:hypothetical protein